MIFSPFSIAITSLGEERDSLGAFRTFVRFALVWFCLFSLPLDVWEGLRFVIVALPGFFSYPPFFLSVNASLVPFPRYTHLYFWDVIHTLVISHSKLILGCTPKKSLNVYY